MNMIGRYEIRGELGRGGFGAVYRAFDPVVRRNVAIKLLSSVDDPDVLKRFRREADTTGNLRHPNIITIYDYGEHEAQPYIVMELLEGRSLKEIVTKGPALEIASIGTIMLQVAEALQYAHQRGVIHRDIKPANIMLLTDGEAKVLDFGVARFVGSKTRHTQSGMIVGTIEFMAPEQLRGEEADAVSDIFSYGVTFYELLSGLQPFRGRTLSEVVNAITNLEPPPLREKSPRCPEQLDSILRTAMAKKRSDRYQSMDDLLLDLAPIELSLRKGRADELVAEASALAESGNVEGALLPLRKALEMDATHGGGQALRARIKRLRESGVDPQRIQELVRASEELIAKRSFDQGIQRLEMALQMTQTGSAARSEIEKHLEAAKRKRDSSIRVAALLYSAQQAATRGDFDAARQNTAEIAALEPENAEVNTLRQELDERERSFAEQKQREDILRKVAERTRQYIAEQKLDAAADLVRGALARFPGDRLLETLRAEIETAREGPTKTLVTQPVPKLPAPAPPSTPLPQYVAPPVPERLPPAPPLAKQSRWILIAAGTALATGLVIAIPAMLSRGKPAPSFASRITTDPPPHVSPLDSLPMVVPEVTDSSTPPEKTQDKPKQTGHTSEPPKKPVEAPVKTPVAPAQPPPAPTSTGESERSPESVKPPAPTNPPEQSPAPSAPSQPKQDPVVTQSLDANRQGVELFGSGQYENAIAKFSDAINLAPKSSRPYFNRGGAEYKLGRWAAAVADFQKALELEPGIPKAQELIASAQQHLTPKGSPSLYGGADSRPELTHSVQPDYTKEAIQGHVEGAVLVQFVVDERGHTKDIQIKRSLGSGLDEKAVKAVEKWRFKPATKDGKPVPVQTSAEIKFQLSH